MEAGDGIALFTLISLKAQGFKKLDIAEPIRFPRRVLLIHGKNESGKSTVMEAVHYALFGMALRPSKRASNEDIINYHLPEGYVQLDFTIDEDLYQVRRVLKRKGPNIHELRIRRRKGKTEIIRGARAVNNAIVEALHGIDSDTLLHSCLVEQKELGKLESAQLSERARTISALLNLEAFIDAEEEIREKRSLLERENGLKRIELKDLEDKKRRVEEAEEEFKGAEERLKEIEEELPRLRERREELRKTLEMIRTVKEMDREISLLKERLEEAIEGVREAEEKGKEAQRLRGEVEIYSEAQRAGEIGEELEKRLGELRDLNTRYENLLKELEGVKEDWDRVKEVEALLSHRREAVKALEREGRRADLKRIGGIISLALGILTLTLQLPPPLPLILAPFLLLLGAILLATSRKERIDRRLKGVKGEVEDLLTEMAGLKALGDRRTALEEEVVTLEDKIDGMNSLILSLIEKLPRRPRDYSKAVLEAYQEAPISAGALLRGMVQEDLITLQRVKDDLERASAIAEELEGRREERRVLEEELRAKEVEVKRLRLEIEGLKMGLEEEEVEDQLSTIDKRIGGLEEERRRAVTVKEEASRILEEYVDAPERYRALKEEVEGNDFELEAMERAVKLLRSTRDAIVGRVKGSIEKNMSRFLPALTANRYSLVRLDEKEYRVEVYDKEARDWRGKGVFSGATQDQFSLALRLAFAVSIIPSARGARPGFIFLDEPLAGFDTERRTGLMKLLKEELPRYFEQIIIISHVAQLRNEIPNEILMEEGRARQRSIQEIDQSIEI